MALVRLDPVLYTAPKRQKTQPAPDFAEEVDLKDMHDRQRQEFKWVCAIHDNFEKVTKDLKSVEGETEDAICSCGDGDAVTNTFEETANLISGRLDDIEGRIDSMERDQTDFYLHLLDRLNSIQDSIDARPLATVVNADVFNQYIVGLRLPEQVHFC